MKKAEDVMEILEAYDLVGTLRGAAELVGCDHKTVAHYVEEREAAGGDWRRKGRHRPRTNAYDDKIAELVERSEGKVRADKVHERLVAMGYQGSERTTRRAVARAKAAHSDPGNQILPRSRNRNSRYLAGQGGAQRQEQAPSCLDPYRPYIAARFEEDPHLLLSVLHRELAAEGFGHCYSSLVKEVRRLQLRPICPSCKHCRDKAPTVEIDHPPGEEIQWDWLELQETPWRQRAYVLVGALSHSGRFRASFCEQTTLGHLAAAIHPILEGLGGSARSWRVDRMATAVIPGTDRLNPRFGELAKHYGADVAICPPYRPQRKGVVESAIKYLTRSWWRSARVETPSLAQGSLDRWCAEVADRRRRGKTTVASLGAEEPLAPLPPLPFPARIEVERVVSRSALVAFESNHYSVPAAYARRKVIVSMALGEPALRISTAAGELIATHRAAPAGAGQRVRTAAHAAGLERAVLAAFTTRAPCRKKQNRPPGERALTELAALHGHDRAPAVSLEQYAELAEAPR